MNCEACQQLLPDDAEGTLGTEERIGLARHLAACGACREHFAREAALAAQLRATFHRQADALHLAPAARAQILAAVAPQRTHAWWRAPACAAAAAALILCAAHFGLRATLPPPAHTMTAFAGMVTTPDDTMRIEWKSPAHVVIQRSAGWKERRLLVVQQNGSTARGLFVAHPILSWWK